ncbi:MAG TPA: hypothetical protein VKF60_19535 [Myxococcota bacterium]|nr:hypothetical protein [Myxococcota bacterium]
MVRTLITCMALLLAAGGARADEPKGSKDTKTVKDAKTAPKGGDKVLSGISIVGNDDAPKSLVIVPWKSSGLGDALGVGTSLEDGAKPVDRDVFARELDYYGIIAESQNGGSSGQQ